MGYAKRNLLALTPPERMETLSDSEDSSGLVSPKPKECITQFRYSAQQMVKTTEQFSALSPSRRQCLYPHERNLDYFGNYHRTNCMLECA